MDMNSSAAYRLVMLQQELVMILGSSSNPNDILERFTMRAIKSLNLRSIHIIQKENKTLGLESYNHRVPVLAPKVDDQTHLMKYIFAAIPESSEFIEEIQVGEVYWYCYSIRNLGYMIIERHVRQLEQSLIAALNAPITRFGQIYVDRMQFLSIDRHRNQIKIISEHLETERNKLAHILDSISDTVLVLDCKGLVYFMNPAGRHLLNIDESMSINNHFIKYFRILDGDKDIDITTTILCACQQEGSWSHEKPVILATTDNRKLVVRLNVRSMQDHRDDNDELATYYVCTFNDITEAHSLERELTWHVNHDPLTHAYNRRGFEEKMNEILTQERDVPSVLVCMDLDRFKHVNDVGGHLAGDALLQQVTALMLEEVRENDVLARVGGDEFCVVLQECSIDTGLQVAERIRENIDRLRFRWEESIFTIGISLGVTQINISETDVDAIFLRADEACLSSKDNGRNQVTLGDKSSRRKGDDLSLNYLHCVNQALLSLDDSYEFVLHKQDIIPISDTSRDTQQEVLLRIRQGNKLIPPNAFLPSAERSGKVSDIDLWVVERTLQYLRKNKKSRLNVNISGVTLSNCNSRALLYNLISEYPTEAKSLCLEITETSAITNLSKCVAFMEKLDYLGVSFALDDFGTGVSSFIYLKKLPIKYLKIDGTFIKDICNNEIDEIVVQSIISAAKAMKIMTVAEYVSTPEILSKVTELGVDYVQGYHLSKPISLIRESALS